MNSFLLYPDRDFILRKDPVVNGPDLIQDLGLETVLTTMAAGDRVALDVARCVLLSSLRNPEEIVYRQQVLRDCLKQRAVVKELYDIATNALEEERHVWGWLSSKNPESVLHHSVEVLQVFIKPLVRLRMVSEQGIQEFTSPGFQRLFEMFRAELDSEYLRSIQEHLDTVSFRHGMVMSAGLGGGNRLVNIRLHGTPRHSRTWLGRMWSRLDERIENERETYVYKIDERDEAGLRQLSELRGRALAPIAMVLAQSADHVRMFFQTSRLELGFYLSCVNLWEALVKRHSSVCFPEALPEGRAIFHCSDLYDASLLLSTQDNVIGNDIDADGKQLVVIGGANRGGKSTALRSVGLAQVMMQCGMFVPATSFRATVRPHIFTHFKREEDATLKRGKFEEELSRMSEIVDHIRPGDLLLLNESFASTNEREGAEIAYEVVNGFLEAAINVFYVTHMTDLVAALYGSGTDNLLFLRAERLSDGRRTYRVIPAEPETTSYAADLYHQIFGPVAPASGGAS